jgi:two-component system nitrate/nitrite response regulator NarL
VKGAAGRPARPIGENAPYKDFAEHLRELRKTANLTLRKLSERTGYSIGWLSEAESGESLPSLEVTLAFAIACGADPQTWMKRRREAASTGITRLPADHPEKPFSGNQAVLHDHPLANLLAASDPEETLAQDPALSEAAPEQQITVTIIEDHPVAAEGVASWLRSAPGQRMRVVQMARDLTGFRAMPQPTADVIILDLELSGELVTSEILELTAAGYRVVALSGHNDPAIVMEALDNGAHAYVAKEEGRDHLVEAVLAAAADRPYVTRSQARAMLADQRPARPILSQQEQQALLLWFQGMSKASVGLRMSISENTVRQYISRARAKYAATGRSVASKDALLARAIEDGVLKAGEIMPYRSYARDAASGPGTGGLSH